jgi:hypothetical protein
MVGLRKRRSRSVSEARWTTETADVGHGQRHGHAAPFLSFVSKAAGYAPRGQMTS